MLEGALNKVRRTGFNSSSILSLLILSCSGKQTSGHPGQNRSRRIEYGKDGKFDFNLTATSKAAR